MKKIALLFMFCAFATNAQKRKNGTIEVVPAIGYSNSALLTKNTDGMSPRKSTRLGAEADYYFNNRWSLRSGLHFEKMGAEFSTYYSFFGTLNEELNLNYINVPLNANWHFGSSRKWNLNFGITPSFLTSAEYTSNISSKGPEDIKSKINGFQLGISLGIGYKIEVSDDFSIMLDYQEFYGTSNIYTDNAIPTAQNASSSFNIGGVFYFK